MSARLRTAAASSGGDDMYTLSSRNAVARDLRGLGLYQESLDMARQVVDAFERSKAGRTSPGCTRAKGSPPRCARPAITGTRSRRASTYSSGAVTTWAWTTCTRCGPRPT